MEKTKNLSTISKEKKKQRRTYRTHKHSVMEKCQAILSIWTEKRKPADICRELDINWTILSQWQNRALEGMMQALSPRVNLESCPSLSPRLHALLAKKEKQMQKIQVKAMSQKLETRLSRISAPVKKEEKGA